MPELSVIIPSRNEMEKIIQVFKKRGRYVSEETILQIAEIVREYELEIQK